MNHATRPRPGQMVVSADGLPVGQIEAETPTHLNVRTDGDAPTGQLWLPRRMIESVTDGIVRLNVPRWAIHEAVFSLPPSQQREFATLGVNVTIGRARGLGLEPQRFTTE
jgi:hypothetical protein